MKKTIPALIAALLITTIIGGGMFAISRNALTASEVKAQQATTPSAESSAQVEQIAAQYQAREAEYQAQLNLAIEQINTANKNIEQANQKMQEYQSVLDELQNNGIISIANDGTITVNQFASQQGFTRPAFGDHHGGNH